MTWDRGLFKSFHSSRAADEFESILGRSGDVSCRSKGLVLVVVLGIEHLLDALCILDFHKVDWSGGMSGEMAVIIDSRSH